MRFRPQPSTTHGQVRVLRHTSQLLADNHYGDPAERAIKVYVPAAAANSEARFPLLLMLAAYTNSGLALDSFTPFGEHLAQRLDRLIETGVMPPVVVAAPDAYTSFGGNQYVDSLTLGRYSSWLHDELLPFLETALPVIGGPASRAIFGKSSGGFGAIHALLERPGYWAGAAALAPDLGFEWVVRASFPAVAQALAEYRSDLPRFVRRVWRAKRPHPAEVHALMVLGLAASYDPDPDCELGTHLPFDLHTLEVDEERYARWTAFDPVARIAAAPELAVRLEGLALMVGARDQYHVHYGARRLQRLLQAAAVVHDFREFDGTHSGIDHCWDELLPALISRF